MKQLLVFGCLLTAVTAVSFFDLVQEEWLSFKLEHNKTYEDPVTEKHRMSVYADNKYKVIKHNQRFANKQVSFRLKMNHFGDMLHQEFVKTMNGFDMKLKNYNKKQKLNRGATYIPAEHVQLPDHVDWRKRGAVTEIKDQGKCGSCWSFSTTGALEAQHFRKTDVLVSLSEQNLIDCSKKFGNNGCNGGLMDNAFKYIKSNGGVDTERSYPYEGVDDKCRFNKTNVGADDVGFVDVPEGDEEKLKHAVATIGPVSVAIDASQQSFQFYSDGVYYDENCSSTQLDHGVLVVGYGTDEDGGDYWLVKNSWGRNWGDLGYIKMARNRDNHCGIASSASYPLV